MIKNGIITGILVLVLLLLILPYIPLLALIVFGAILIRLSGGDDE